MSGHPRNPARRPAGWLAVVMLAALVDLAVGCERLNMREQASVQPYEPDEAFEYRQSAQPPPQGTVARGHGPDRIASPDPADYSSGRPVTIAPPPERGGPGPYPIPVTEELMKRGQDQYEAFCAPCHGTAGYGNGIVVQRGMVKPPAYHIDRLRRVGPRHIVKVIEEGFARMYSYGARVDPRDRWAIALYIEALQFSQYAPVDQLSGADRRKLGGSP
ncbi:MAG: cytochrome c [Bradymonadaceae bacterium]